MKNWMIVFPCVIIYVSGYSQNNTISKLSFFPANSPFELFKVGISPYQADKIVHLSECYKDVNMNLPSEYKHYPYLNGDSVLITDRVYKVPDCLSFISSDCIIKLRFSDDYLCEVSCCFYFDEDQYKHAYFKYLSLLDSMSKIFLYKNDYIISRNGTQTGEGVYFYNSIEDHNNEKINQVEVSLDKWSEDHYLSGMHFKASYLLEIANSDLKGTKLTTKAY